MFTNLKKKKKAHNIIQRQRKENELLIYTFWLHKLEWGIFWEWKISLLIHVPDRTLTYENSKMIISPTDESVSSIYALLKNWQLAGNTQLQTCVNISSLNIWNQHSDSDASTGQDTINNFHQRSNVNEFIFLTPKSCSLVPPHPTLPHCSETRALQCNGTQAPDLGKERLQQRRRSFYKAKYIPFKELYFL